MTKEQIVQKIKEIIVDVLDIDTPPEKLEDENLIENYGLNSVDALEILMHIEKKFSIEIDEDDLTSELVNSTNQLASYIQQRLPSVV